MGITCINSSKSVGQDRRAQDNGEKTNGGIERTIKTLQTAGHEGTERLALITQLTHLLSFIIFIR